MTPCVAGRRRAAWPRRRARGGVGERVGPVGGIEPAWLPAAILPHRLHVEPELLGCRLLRHARQPEPQNLFELEHRTSRNAIAALRGGPHRGCLAPPMGEGKALQNPQLRGGRRFCNTQRAGSLGLQIDPDSSPQIARGWGGATSTNPFPVLAQDEARREEHRSEERA
jgi:hypothetical protein